MEMEGEAAPLRASDAVGPITLRELPDGSYRVELKSGRIIGSVRMVPGDGAIPTYWTGDGYADRGDTKEQAASKLRDDWISRNRKRRSKA